jgi:hypothetical protein
VAGAALVLSGIPATGSAQEAASALIGYEATASGTALTAFPRIPALLPVEAPVEATVALATATLSSGGQGFGRASTFYPGSLAAGLRPLLETGTGTRLPIPDYPIVVEAREFEEAKRSELPGLAMSADADPARAVAVADVGSIGLPAVVGISSIRTESRTVLDADAVTATSTTTLHGIDLAGVLHIGTLVSTASVRADGTTSTCQGSVRISDADVAGTPITIDDDGIEVAGTALPGLGLGPLLAQLLAASGVEVRVLGGTDGCGGSLGNRTSAGLLLRIPTPELGPITAGGLQLVLGSTSAAAGGSTLPRLEEGASPSVDLGGPSALGPGTGLGATDLGADLAGPAPAAPAGPASEAGGDALLAARSAGDGFDGVPGSLLAGLLLLAVAGAGRVRRYVHHLIGLVDP